MNEWERLNQCHTLHICVIIPILQVERVFNDVSASVTEIEAIANVTGEIINDATRLGMANQERAESVLAKATSLATESQQNVQVRGGRE